MISLICGATPLAGAEELYRREVNQANPNGKDLKMVFEETKREEKTSTVKITWNSGASVASMMFILECGYDMARARKMKYFIKLKEWVEGDDKVFYSIGFSNDKDTHPMTQFKLSENVPNTPPIGWQSVDELKDLFDEEEKK